MGPARRWMAVLLLAAACHRDGPSDASFSAIVDAGETLASLDADEAVHFTRLKPFLPETLGALHGGETRSSTSQYPGGFAVSQVERDYLGSGRRSAVRILDTNLNRKAGVAVRAEAADAPHARPFESGNAKGYLDYDPQKRVAQARVVISQRFVLDVTVEDTPDDREAERTVRAIDLKGLEKLASAKP